jgi:hypothetical protein
MPLCFEEAALLLRTTLIAVAVAMTVPAYAQQSSPKPGIWIITPYGEHVYSADPAAPRLLDDENLQLQNERAERARVLRQMEMDRREAAERQEALDAENSN